jgi:hypothetical protein
MPVFRQILSLSALNIPDPLAIARYCIYFNDVFQYRFVVDRTKRLRDYSHIHHLLLLLLLHKNLLQKVLEIVSFLTAYKRTGRSPAHVVAPEHVLVLHCAHSFIISSMRNQASKPPKAVREGGAVEQKEERRKACRVSSCAGDHDRYRCQFMEGCEGDELGRRGCTLTIAFMFLTTVKERRE